MPKFDLTKTQALVDLFSAPKQERGQEWRKRFYQAVPDATLVAFDPQMNKGPDQFPYFHLAIPEPGPLTPFCITHILDFALDNGCGIAIFGDAGRSGAPEWVFRYGDLLALRLCGDFDCGPAPPVLAERLNQDRQVLICAPSAAYLPEYARGALDRFARTVLQHPDPKVLMVATANPPLNYLMFNLTLDDYGGDEEKLQAALGRLAWFLPASYGVLAMPADWDQSGFVPLA